MKRGTLAASLAAGALLGAAGCGGGGAGAAAPQAGATPVDADLVAIEITVAEALVEAGQSIGVSLRAHNTGPAAVPAFRMGVYLSVDAVHDALDARLGYWSVASLAAGADASAGGTLNVPLATLAGDWRVLLVVDDLAALSELDESNNTLAAPDALRVDPPTLPNLVPTALSFAPFTVAAGTTVEVTDAVRNEGVGIAGEFRIGVYLSSDPIVTTADVLLGFRTLVSLDPGASEAALGELTVPPTLAAGNYHVGALVDDLQQVTESIESDNLALAGALLEVLAAPEADLAALGLTFSPSSVDVGAPLRIEESVANAGTVAAGAFQVGVYLSSDADIDPASDVLLGFRTVPSLAGGATSASGPVDLVVPPTVAAGLWFVGVSADHTNLVPDPNRANNVFVALERVEVEVPPLPDLVADSITFSPATIDPATGVSLQVDELVRNAGVNAAGAFRVSVYLSDNQVISTSDALLGSRVLGELAVGGGSGAGASFPLPPGLSNGSYFVALFVDDLSQQQELSEANNVRIAAGTLDVTSAPSPMPNLVTELVDPSASQVQPGHSIQLVTRVKNVGTASASSGFRVGFYLSTDETITTDDLFVGDRLVPFGLGIGFTSVASVPVTIPTGTPVGTYRIGALADWSLSIAESDETDNGRAAPGPFAVAVPPPPAPNLRVSSLSLTVAGPVAAGGSFDVDHAIRNAGNLAAGSFRAGIYLSTDATLDLATDVLVDSRVISLLDPGATDSLVESVVLPAGIAPGLWYVGVYADDLAEVAEQDEGDNWRMSANRITVQ